GRKMARENNIDLSRVKGTGIGGRITKLDLETYLGGQSGTAVAPIPAAASTPLRAPPAAPPPPAPVREAAPTSSSVPATMAGAPAAMRVEPMSIMRQKIAEHMTFSKHTSAHVTTV